MMVRFSLLMKRLAQWGDILVPMEMSMIWWMCVHEIVVAMFKDDIEDCGSFKGSQAVSGKRCLYSTIKWMTAFVPSSCQMFDSDLHYERVKGLILVIPM